MFKDAIKVLVDCDNPKLEDAIDALRTLSYFCVDGVEMDEIYEILENECPYYWEAYKEAQENVKV